uniref:Uncharacterized protein n=1 Tax=Anguilla anguilla TaxID=7936 RepID=A0A0E9STA4_ANGAN
MVCRLRFVCAPRAKIVSVERQCQSLKK